MALWRMSNGGSETAAARRSPRLSVSLTGVVFCAMVLVMGVAAVNSQANPLFAIFGVMIGVLLISGSISRMVLRKLNVKRTIVGQAVVGRRLTLLYECANEKRYWPSLSVTLSEIDAGDAFVKRPLAYMMHAAAQRTARVPVEVIPKRRGPQSLDELQLTTGFPFGFVRRSRSRRQKETLLVYPAIGRVDAALLGWCRAAETSVAQLRPTRGGNDEFYGIKQYRTGENPRWIYWRRSARTGVLVSREMTMVSPPRLMVLLDTCVRERSVEEHGRVEKAIAMAASLADHALESGLMLGLHVWSNGWVTVKPERGKRHRRDLLELLARLPLNTEHDTAELMESCMGSIRPETTPVLLTARESGWARGPRHATDLRVISVDGAEARAWFRFDQTVDFSTAMPSDQQPAETE